MIRREKQTKMEEKKNKKNLFFFLFVVINNERKIWKREKKMIKIYAQNRLETFKRKM